MIELERVVSYVSDTATSAVSISFAGVVSLSLVFSIFLTLFLIYLCDISLADHARIFVASFILFFFSMQMMKIKLKKEDTLAHETDSIRKLRHTSEPLFNMSSVRVEPQIGGEPQQSYGIPESAAYPPAAIQPALGHQEPQPQSATQAAQTPEFIGSSYYNSGGELTNIFKQNFE